MERRDFLMTACAAGTVAATSAVTGVLTQPAAEAHDLPDNKSLIGWQVYTCGTAEKKKKLLAIFDQALIPALNRQKISPVGVFETSAELNPGEKTYEAANDLRVYVLCQYANIDALLQMTPKLLADKKYMSEAAAIFNAPMNDPLYDTCEVTLMLGFNHCPKIEVPTLDADRIVQWRLYNSFNIERNAKKIDMFDIGGELELFRKCNMSPVFFGETLAGRMMPNLTYMLGFKNPAEKEAAWKKFGESDEWKAISGDPQYKDTANKIVNLILKPSANSQV
ncbi:MAG: NIPSNAP family protein [Planctomycetaceae bacterium]|nr:NIPSNAP family protein [Planctomycetaceae bacterium]